MTAGERFGSKHMKQSCSDLCCCVFFLTALVALMFLGGVGFLFGKLQVIQQFAHGSDQSGQICGQDAAVKDFKLVYFTLPNTTDVGNWQWNSQSRSKLKAICTNTCPQPTQLVADPFTVAGLHHCLQHR